MALQQQLPPDRRTAPDFELPNQFGEPVRLELLRGQPVFLVFYPFAFSRVCTGELGQLRDAASMFDDAGARVLAISCDSRYALRAYAEAEALPFDLLADFWPHGRVAGSYGAFDEQLGRPVRLTAVIRADGTVAESFRTDPGEARPLEAYRAALARLDHPPHAAFDGGAASGSAPAAPFDRSSPL